MEQVSTEHDSLPNNFLYGERAIHKAELICFPNPKPSRNYEVSIELPEFTCKCPFSGYPDLAVLRVNYQPAKKVLELKSIKLFINSFRDIKISHEDVANKILDKFIEACDPSWIYLEADFNPRGNVHTIIKLSHGIKKNYLI